jgi:hypothetical protein
MNEDAKKAQETARIQMLARVKNILEEKDSDAAIEFIERQDDFKAVVNSYNTLIFDLYNKEKNLGWMVPIANAGISYCLGKSRELADKDAEMATKLKSIAKVISFNLASFTWPGWDEEGITVTEADLAAGLAAAKLNLKLVEELGKDPAQLSNSYWTVGSHYLARNTPKDYDKAIEAFNQAAEQARVAKSTDGELMNTGYVAMARILKGDQAQADFDASIKALKEMGTDDAKFFAKQLEDVLKVFSR